jgi:excisionase family DNA binding protein
MQRQPDAYLLDKRQAAKYLNISLGSLERLMRAGLSYVKIQGLVRFRPETLAEYIEANTRVGGGGRAA